MNTVTYLNASGLRVDGRRPGETRAIRASIGTTQGAGGGGVHGRPVDGSAYLEMGNTKVLACVYGPSEILGAQKFDAPRDRAILRCRYTTAPFARSVHRRQRRGDKRAVAAASTLQKAFEATVQLQLYPNSQIEIAVQVLQADGGELAACVNASTLALIDAGVAMDDFLGGSE